MVEYLRVFLHVGFSFCSRRRRRVAVKGEASNGDPADCDPRVPPREWELSPAGAFKAGTAMRSLTIERGNP